MPFELMENMSIISLNLENMHSLDNQMFGLPTYLFATIKYVNANLSGLKSPRAPN